MTDIFWNYHKTKKNGNRLFSSYL